MDIELQSRLLRLKGFLNEINHISYTYAQMGRNYPMNEMDNTKAKALIKVYEELLQQVETLTNSFLKTKGE